jgi:hypothetical protein
MERKIYKLRVLTTPAMTDPTLDNARDQMLHDAFLIEECVAKLTEKVRWLWYAVGGGQRKLHHIGHRKVHHPRGGLDSSPMRAGKQA